MKEREKRKNESKREIEKQINILCKSCIFYNTGESVGRKDTFSRFVTKKMNAHLLEYIFPFLITLSTLSKKGIFLKEREK